MSSGPVSFDPSTFTPLPVAGQQGQQPVKAPRPPAAAPTASPAEAAPMTPATLIAKAMGQATAAAVPQGHGIHIPSNADLSTDDIIDRTNGQGPTMSERLFDLKIAAQNRLRSMSNELQRQLKGGGN